MKVSDFIALCASAQPVPYDKSKRDIRIVQSDKGVARCVDGDPFKADIIQALKCDDPDKAMHQYDIPRMIRGLKYSLIVDGNNEAQTGIEILNTLNAVIGSNITSYHQFEHDGWKYAIALLKGYIEVDSLFCKSLQPDKTSDRARAALELRSRGVIVTVNESELEFDHMDAVYVDLENRIKNFGGRHFIESLLSELPYNNVFGRFILPKRGNEASIPTSHNPAEPYNYLLNLGLKYLASEGIEQLRTAQYFSGIKDLAKTICFATFSVESYSFWEHIFLGDKNPVEYITDFILRESVFNLDQSSLKFITSFVKFICYNYGEAIDESKLNFKLREYCSVMKMLTDLGNPGKFTVVSIKSLKDRHVSKSTITHIVNGLALPIDKFNHNFSYPNDYGNVDYWNYPIARIDSHRILLFPLSISARGWYEGLLNLIRQAGIEIDPKVGSLIENYLYKMLAKRHITCISGKYTLPDKAEGECDGLIESAKRIILIEVKERSLVRDSRSGTDYQILNNLCDTLKAQLQCLKTAYGLRNSSPFVLESGDGADYNVFLNNRNIERITLTLFPYGAIQDRAIFEKTIELFLKYRFIAPIVESGDDPATLEKKENVAAKLKPLTKIIGELGIYLNKTQETRPLFNGWFLDLEQLLFLINSSDGADEFTDNLLKHKYLSAGTLDFYNETLALGLID